MSILFFELLTGQLPFAADKQALLLRQILQEEPRPLSDLAPHLPEKLGEILQKGLEKEKENRYASIDEMAAELKALYQELYKPADAKGVSLKVAVALAILLVLGSLALGWRLFGRKEVEPGLAVFYFQNLASPEDQDRLGQMVTNLLITSLSQEGELPVFSIQKLSDILRSRGSEQVVDEETARQVAQEAGVPKIVLGSVSRKGARVAVQSRIVDVQSGALLASPTGEGKGELAGLFEIVHSLSGEIRTVLEGKNVADSKKESETDWLQAATTTSEEAYRQYVAGLDLLNRSNFGDAQTAFEKAMEFDPEFALAHYRLAMTQVWWVPDPEVIERAQKALGRNLGRLPKRERESIEAFLAFVGEKYDKSLELYLALNRKYPDEKETLYWVGDNYRRLERESEAIPYFERVLELDQDFVIAYGSLLRCASVPGQQERALAFAQRFAGEHPKHARAQGLLGDVLQMRGQLAAARALYGKAIEIDPSFRDAYANMAGTFVLEETYDEALRLYEKSYDRTSSLGYVALQNMGCVALHQGRFQEARNYFRQKKELGERFQDKRILSTSYQDLSFSDFLEGDLDGALREMEQAYDVYGGQVRPYWRAYRGWLHIRRGELAWAKLEYDKIVAKAGPKNKYALHLRGRILLAEGKNEEAISVLNQAPFQEKAHFRPVHLEALASAYTANGQLEKARETYSRLIAANFLIPIGSTSIVNRVAVLVYPMAYYRLGVIAEKLGNLPLAHNCYTRFTQLWAAAKKLETVQEAKRKSD